MRIWYELNTMIHPHTPLKKPSTVLTIEIGYFHFQLVDIEKTNSV
jgi:hypothetical protein